MSLGPEGGPFAGWEEAADLGRSICFPGSQLYVLQHIDCKPDGSNALGQRPHPWHHHSLPQAAAGGPRQTRPQKQAADHTHSATNNNPKAHACVLGLPGGRPNNRWRVCGAPRQNKKAASCKRMRGPEGCAALIQSSDTLRDGTGGCQHPKRRVLKEPRLERNKLLGGKKKACRGHQSALLVYTLGAPSQAKPSLPNTTQHKSPRGKRQQRCSSRPALGRQNCCWAPRARCPKHKYSRAA